MILRSAGWPAIAVLAFPFPHAAAAVTNTAAVPHLWNEGISRLVQVFASNAGERGYRLDYSVPSIDEVERAFAERARVSTPRTGGMLEYDSAAAVNYFGLYLGEVLVRHRPGRWEQDSTMDGRRFRLSFADGSIADPVQRVGCYAAAREARGALAAYMREQLVSR